MVLNSPDNSNVLDNSNNYLDNQDVQVTETIVNRPGSAIEFEATIESLESLNTVDREVKDFSGIKRGRIISLEGSKAVTGWGNGAELSSEVIFSNVLESDNEIKIKSESIGEAEILLTSKKVTANTRKLKYTVFNIGNFTFLIFYITSVISFRAG